MFQTFTVTPTMPMFPVNRFRPSPLLLAAGMLMLVAPAVFAAASSRGDGRKRFTGNFGMVGKTVKV